MIIGSHVGMGGKEMFLGSAKEAAGYGADALMIYTGAPQNTKRKPIEELKIQEGWDELHQHEIEHLIVHAPYIINLGNGVKEDIFELAVRFLRLELERSEAMGGEVLVVHPGAHVGEGVDRGIERVIQGLNQVLDETTTIPLALETMAGKGSELGRSFEELARIFDGVKHNERLRVCIDTCHMHDAGYDLCQDWEGVLQKLDQVIGLDRVAVVHLNDSKNLRGAAKDRHENIGFGAIGFDTLYRIAACSELSTVPKILETPYVPGAAKKTFPPYKYEIAMLRSGVFDPALKQKIVEGEL